MEVQSEGDQDATGVKSESGATASTSNTAPQSSMLEKKTDMSTRADKKREYEGKRVRLFIPTWEKEFPWVEYDPAAEKMYCKICRKHPELHDATSNLVIGTSSFRKRALQTHDIATEHMRCMKEDHRKANPTEAGPMDVVLEKVDDDAINQLTVLFNTAFFVAKKKNPFSSYSDLLGLQEKNGINVGQQYRNDKQCRDFISHIAEVSNHPHIN